VEDDTGAGGHITGQVVPGVASVGEREGEHRTLAVLRAGYDTEVAKALGELGRAQRRAARAHPVTLAGRGAEGALMGVGEEGRRHLITVEVGDLAVATELTLAVIPRVARRACRLPTRN